MCKCAWLKKLFGLKKDCCCSHHEDEKDVNVTDNAPVEPISNVGDNNETTPVASQDPAVETPAEERKEAFEQK